MIVQIKFLGMTGSIDFDHMGLRRSVQLKILDLSTDGLVEMGTWTRNNRLAMSQRNVQQSLAIRKHLQVVTREVTKISPHYLIFSFFLFQRKNLMFLE